MESSKGPLQDLKSLGVLWSCPKGPVINNLGCWGRLEFKSCSIVLYPHLFLLKTFYTPLRHKRKMAYHNDKKFSRKFHTLNCPIKKFIPSSIVTQPGIQSCTWLTPNPTIRWFRLCLVVQVHIKKESQKVGNHFATLHYWIEYKWIELNSNMDVIILKVKKDPNISCMRFSRHSGCMWTQEVRAKMNDCFIPAFQLNENDRAFLLGMCVCFRSFWLKSYLENVCWPIAFSSHLSMLHLGYRTNLDGQ